MPVVAALAALLAVPATARADAPWPCFDVAQPGFATAVEGAPYDLDASCSSDTDGHELVSFDWDLDGDGTFETAMGADPLLTHTFADRGAFLDATVRFGLKVTDVAGESSSFSYPIRVTDAINGWFNFEPRLVNPGDTVKLTATTAHVDAEVLDPQMTYAWDLDGDGAFEASTGALPTASSSRRRRPAGTASACGSATTSGTSRR
ncbi:MAG TPA: hypothetical protein VGW75_12535 [Solirubrobacteraceae bacterium]|nr:hypothetical protein [Solirubrobacteraceae bacterium]